MTENKPVGEVRRERPFVFPPSVLKFLGGVLEEVDLPERKVTLVKEGAYLWGVDNLEAGKGIFNHVCLVGRMAYYLATTLKEKSSQLGDGKYEDLDPNLTAMLGVCHDAVKLHSGSNPNKGRWIAGREDLTSEEKQRLGLPRGYKEISPEADEIVVEWLAKYPDLPKEFVEKFKEVIVGHDFSVDPKAYETTYQKLIQIADFSVSQKFMTTKERWIEVADRWVKPFVKNWEEFSETDTLEIIKNHWQEFEVDIDKPPRIEPQRLVRASELVQQVADEVFSYLGMTQEEFNQRYLLNEKSPEPAWEMVLRETWESDYRFQTLGGQGAPYSRLLK